jgi:hypothetical protein
MRPVWIQWVFIKIATGFFSPALRGTGPTILSMSSSCPSFRYTFFSAFRWCSMQPSLARVTGQACVGRYACVSNWCEATLRYSAKTGCLASRCRNWSILDWILVSRRFSSVRVWLFRGGLSSFLFHIYRMWSTIYLRYINESL